MSTQPIKTTHPSVLSKLPSHNAEQHASEQTTIRVEYSGKTWKVDLPQGLLYNCKLCKSALAMKTFCDELSHNYCEPCYEQMKPLNSTVFACPTCPTEQKQYDIQYRDEMNQHLIQALQNLLVQCNDCGEEIEFKLASGHTHQKQYSPIHTESATLDDTEHTESATLDDTELLSQFEGFGLDMTASFQITPRVIEEARSLELANELIAIDKAQVQDQSVPRKGFTRQASVPINIPISTPSATTKTLPPQDTHSQIRSPAIRSISSEDKPSSSLDQTSSDNSGSHDTAGIEQWLGSEELLIENSISSTSEPSIQTGSDDLPFLGDYEVVQQNHDLEAPSSTTGPNTDEVDGGWTMIGTDTYYNQSS